MASETLAKIDRAYDVVSALCEGKREWLMSIPARPDHDPDLIIGDALLAAKNEIARLAAELEEARERERAVRDEATGYLEEVVDTLADMHYGEECSFEGGDGCLACYAQDRIAEMKDALAARTANRSDSYEQA